jgi:hypothetical protein
MDLGNEEFPMSTIDMAATTTMLLQKLLRLDRPQITETMAPLLETPESRRIFLNYLFHPSDHSNKSIQDSYWVSKLLGEDITGAKILATLYDDVFIATLLRCFQQGQSHKTTPTPTPTTTAWIPHVCVVLGALLRGQADDITRVLTQSTASCLVHLTALCNHADTPLVSGVLQDFVCLPSPLPGQPAISCSTELQNVLRQRLAEMDVWSMFVSIVVAPGVPLARSEAAANCFMTSLQRTAVNAHAASLAESLVDSAGRIVDTLVSFSHGTLLRCQANKTNKTNKTTKTTNNTPDSVEPVHPDTTTRVELCVQCLLSLIEWTMPRMVDAPSVAAYQSFGGTMVVTQENTLHGACQVAMSKLIELRECIFDLLRGLPVSSNDTLSTDTAVKHTGYSTPAPFTLVRLNLVYILHQMLLFGVQQDDKDEAETEEDEAAPSIHIVAEATQPVTPLVSQVPAVLWRLLGTWFCIYPHSSLYHHIFVRVFALVLGSESDIAVKGIIKRAKKKKKKSDVGFLSRIMRHYIDGDPNSSVRGHILHCLNIVRLRAQVSSSESYLCVYLRDLEEWRDFLPGLEASTIATVSAPPFDVPVKWGDVAKTDFSIEHGSAWAKSLGFHTEHLSLIDDDSDESFSIVD